MTTYTINHDSMTLGSCCRLVKLNSSMKRQGHEQFIGGVFMCFSYNGRLRAVHLESGYAFFGLMDLDNEWQRVEHELMWAAPEDQTAAFAKSPVTGSCYLYQTSKGLSIVLACTTEGIDNDRDTAPDSKPKYLLDLESGAVHEPLGGYVPVSDARILYRESVP